MPILIDKVVDLSSRKIESISRIGLPSPKGNQLSFFFRGGGGFWILTFLGRVPKKRPKNVSWKKIDLHGFPHFLSN